MVSPRASRRTPRLQVACAGRGRDAAPQGRGGERQPWTLRSAALAAPVPPARAPGGDANLAPPSGADPGRDTHIVCLNGRKAKAGQRVVQALRGPHEVRESSSRRHHKARPSGSGASRTRGNTRSSLPCRGGAALLLAPQRTLRFPSQAGEGPSTPLRARLGFRRLGILEGGVFSSESDLLPAGVLLRQIKGQSTQATLSHVFHFPSLGSLGVLQLVECWLAAKALSSPPVSSAGALRVPDHRV